MKLGDLTLYTDATWLIKGFMYGAKIRNHVQFTKQLNFLCKETPKSITWQVTVPGPWCFTIFEQICFYMSLYAVQFTVLWDCLVISWRPGTKGRSANFGIFRHLPTYVVFLLFQTCCIVFDVFPGSADDCRHKFALLSHVYTFRIVRTKGLSCDGPYCCLAKHDDCSVVGAWIVCQVLSVLLRPVFYVTVCCSILFQHTISLFSI